MAAIPSRPLAGCPTTPYHKWLGHQTGRARRGLDGGAAYLGWPFSAQTLLRCPGKPEGGRERGREPGAFCLWPFLGAFLPHLASSCLHSWVPHPSRLPHPAGVPRPSVPLPPTTHAKGQQENVEQKLDTLHSSFHRHGCWAWGRGKHGDENRKRGAPAPQLAAGPRSLPCAAPIAALPTRKPAVRSTSPCPLHPAAAAAVAAAGQGWGRGLAASGSRDAPRARPAGLSADPDPPPGPRGRRGVPSVPRASRTSRPSCSRAGPGGERRARCAGAALWRLGARCPAGRPRGPPARASPSLTCAPRRLPTLSSRPPAAVPRAPCSRPACRAAPPRLQPAPSPAGWPPASLM